MTYRIAKINEDAQLIYLINSQLGIKKNRTKLDFSSLSDSVAPIGLKSNHLAENFRVLATIT